MALINLIRDPKVKRPQKFIDYKLTSMSQSNMIIITKLYKKGGLGVI